MTAPLAGERLFGLNAIPLRRTLALGADMIFTVAILENVLKAGVVTGEHLEEIADVKALLVLLLKAHVFLFHEPKLARFLPYVKGIIPQMQELVDI
ncbi:MAG: hypothetical protein U1F71_13440 [Verrucomicrobiaceae bacterium]